MNAFLAWLLTNAAIVAAMVPIVWLASWRLRTRPAIVHLLWFVLLLKLVLPPVGQWPWTVAGLESRLRSYVGGTVVQFDVVDAPVTGGQVIRLAGDPAPSSAGSSEVGSFNSQIAPLDAHAVLPGVHIPVREAPDSAYQTPEFLAAALLAAWLIGSACMAAILLTRLSRQRQLLREAEAAPFALAAAMRRVADQLGVPPPPIAVSRRLSSPVVCCAGRPCLLWPTTMTKSDQVEQSGAVLAHELAHLVRRDHWLLRVELLVVVACWWNPLLWLIRRRLHETRELACDALALAATGQPRKAYADQLLNHSVAQFRMLPLAPAFGAGTASRRVLKRRLTMIFDDRVRGRLSGTGLSLGLVLAAISLPGFAWAEPSLELTNDESGASASVIASPGGPVGTTIELTQDANDVVIDDIAVDATLEFETSEGIADGETAGEGGRTVSSRRLSQWQSSSVFDAGELDEPREFLFPGGGGKVRISKGADGNLIVRIEQTRAGQNGEPTGSAGRTRRRAQNGEPFGSVSIGGSSSSAGTVASSGRAGAVDTGSTDATSFGGTFQGNGDMLRLNMELAQIDLEERRIELEVAKEQGAAPSQLRLAELAVRRAEIKLEQAKLRMSGSIRR